MLIDMDEYYFAEKLDSCESYGEIFDLVKKAVKKTIGLHRVGLLLYLENLPPYIGAYHQVGSNGIVLNKLLIGVMSKSLISKTEFNSLIFSLLLHEYLHSLGYLDERKVKQLVYEISLKTFGKEHPAVKMALQPPLLNIPELYSENYVNHSIEIVKDFERIEHPYVA
ncbi:MAG: hypothetical protein QXK89_09875 [Candidatus Bathyarchaeia archaeon]|nr:hypothetical protein [Candidatus Bathyarchaeota archaeon]